MYAKAIESVARLYGEDLLFKKAAKIKETLLRLSFDGKIFRDNLVRKNGKLILTDNYSETCQYYAIFCGMSQGEAYEKFLLEKYGAADAAELPEASNMLTGHCLRLWWLLERDYKKECILEAQRMFLNMAKRTGTLWENDKPTASCNHGFTSILSVFLADALFGYKGYDAANEALLFDENFYKETDCALSLTVGGKPLEMRVENGKRTIVNGTDFKIVKGAKK